MRWNPLKVSMDTVIATSPLIGQELEDRRPIGAAQDKRIARRLAFSSATPLRGQMQRDLFCVAPLDLLVSEQHGRKQFHLLELNGTGIGDLTNLTDRAVCAVLESLAESCTTFDDPDGVVLLAVSGKESASNPRLNRLMHEKLLFVEAIRQGLSRRFGQSEATNLAMLKRNAESHRRARPAVVLGYIKELPNDLAVDFDGSVWLHGRQVVIKPHGTGLGHGIEFFLDLHEPIEKIMARIDRSLALTEEYYGLAGGAFPYTVCEYVGACRVRSKGHPLAGHRYELRVVVYRHGMTLRAFPSIAKIARERDDHSGRVRRALINNITACGDTSKVRGVDYMLPLCSERTLELLDLSLDEIESLCSVATEYVRYVLDQVEDRPERFGLPASRPSFCAAEVQAAA